MQLRFLWPPQLAEPAIISHISLGNASLSVRTCRSLPAVTGYQACSALPIALLALLCSIRSVCYPLGGESSLSGDLHCRYIGLAARCIEVTYYGVRY